METTTWEPNRWLDVDGRRIATDSEGYLIDRDQWSEAFARALARKEHLELTPQHWGLLRTKGEH